MDILTKHSRVTTQKNIGARVACLFLRWCLEALVTKFQSATLWAVFIGLLANFYGLTIRAFVSWVSKDRFLFALMSIRNFGNGFNICIFIFYQQIGTECTQIRLIVRVGQNRFSSTTFFSSEEINLFSYYLIRNEQNWHFLIMCSNALLFTVMIQIHEIPL
jgi:hypothetical protein